MTEMGQWNILVNKTIPEFLKGDFAMSVHEDGFPIRPELWDDHFLDYDYIGAPWKDGVVGNGGFNIESQKLLQLKVKMPFCPIPPGPSDYWVCRDNRYFLEQQGIRFAPAEVALKFSTEKVGGENPSFGFHGRSDKYGKGWERIEYWERGIGKVDLAYIFVLGYPEFLEQAKRFVASYTDFPPQHPHDTIVVCNNGIPNQEEMDIFKPLPGVRFLHRDNSGHDIGGYIAAAKTSNADVLVCLGASVHFFREGWLKRMMEAWFKHGPGLYGSQSSFEVTPHINTTGFWCEPNLLAYYPYTVTTREDRYNFEHGCYNRCINIAQPDTHKDRVLWRMNKLSGSKTMLVTWDGEYEWWDWRLPKNILRRGDQTNLLLWWKHTDGWFSLPESAKPIWSKSTDTLKDPAFNLEKKTFTND
jgi:hypothetical protein